MWEAVQMRCCLVAEWIHALRDFTKEQNGKTFTLFSILAWLGNTVNQSFSPGWFRLVRIFYTCFSVWKFLLSLVRRDVVDDSIILLSSLSMIKLGNSPRFILCCYVPISETQMRKEEGWGLIVRTSIFFQKWKVWIIELYFLLVDLQFLFFFQWVQCSSQIIVYENT